SHRRRQMRKAEAFPACEKFFLMLRPKGAECQLCRRPFTLEDDGAQDESCQKALMQIGTCAPSIQFARCSPGHVSSPSNLLKGSLAIKLPQRKAVRGRIACRAASRGHVLRHASGRAAREPCRCLPIRPLP